MIPMPGKARKVRGIPEFMTYDSIVASTKPEEAPAQPETIPDTPPKEKPPRREDDPRRAPFRNPSTEPVPDVDPKAKIKKFNLIGIPYQLIIGKKSEGDNFEFKEIGTESQNLKLEEIVSKINKAKSN